jgi:hypothetical protein
MKPVPRRAYVIALGSGWMCFLVFCLSSLRLALVNSYPLFFAVALCAPAAAVVALKWPAGSWRWGLWVSSGFWLFLGTVFASFLAQSQLEWMPAAEAVGVAASSCLAAALGARLAGTGPSIL